MSSAIPKIQPALIFIPDVSGFTQFVADTEIQHSRHIIEELLEILIEANDLGLEISEIEGDAILFYRFGQAPTAAELLAQVQKMFVRFHAHLKKYETHRICSCGACKSAHNLSLKFVAHYGEITENKIKSYRKLFGKNVIVAHRLLKNGIGRREYALFTQNLVRACSNWVEVSTVVWADLEHSEETYDVGNINYCYLALTPLMDYVPEPLLEDYSVPGLKKRLFHSQSIIEAPIETVFNIVADLPWRTKWIPDTLEETTDINHQILQNGNTHRCLANGPTVITHDFQKNPDTITFTETDTKRTLCVVYTLKKLDEQRTLVSGDAFMKKHLLLNLFFRLFIKKKMSKTYEFAWANLNQYCQSLRNAGKEHPYKLVLEGEPTVIGN